MTRRPGGRFPPGRPRPHLPPLPSSPRGGARRLPPPLPLLLLLLLLAGGCSSPAPAGDAGCLACHGALEKASPSHDGCVSCHGGNGAARGKEEAHRGMRGGANPSAPRHWQASCGGCHPYPLARVRSGLMATNAGMIRHIRLAWEGGEEGFYTTPGEPLRDESGHPAEVRPVAALPGLSGELYRKFCSLCHVGAAPDGVEGASHASGCAACHFPFADDGRYRGGDPTVRGKEPYSESHAMASLPDERACLRCHNRSGRIALTYRGRNDGNSARVPTRDGGPGPRTLGGGRSVTAIAPDVHAARGMECIDCHTSRDVMGDGYAYGNLFRQVEVACEDCHGSYGAPPRTRELSRENEEAVRESRRYGRPLRPGTQAVLTSKGRPYSNVFLEGGRVLLAGKRDGKLRECRQVTATAPHAVAGHERLGCHACHSRAVPQCFGCHTKYDRSEAGYDFVLGRETPGSFSETEDWRSLHPFPLCIGERGRIVPATPGCQTFVTVTGEDGREERREEVMPYRGTRSVRFAPFFSHNVGEKAVGCAACHADPAFAGLGGGVFSGASFEGTLRCDRDDGRTLDALVSLRDGVLSPVAAVNREGGRPLSQEEVGRLWRVNTCLPCHDAPRDNIYRRKLDYRALDDGLHRRLLSAAPATAGSPGPGSHAEGVRRDIPARSGASPAATVRAGAATAGGPRATAAPPPEATVRAGTSPCLACHGDGRSGAHGRLACAACHGDDGDGREAAACVRCHRAEGGVLRGPMAHRRSERAFAARTAGRFDPGFFDAACAGCHVSSCGDCHEGGAHRTARPGAGRCLSCHKGDFTGPDYLGLAPREDASRFARGAHREGEHYLSMLPDVHREAGMECGACHTMGSLAAGRRSGKGCPDCHVPSPSVPGHAEREHLEGMRCVACHGAWAAQQYGTFVLRTGGEAEALGFEGRKERGGYLLSTYLRRQDAPPLGLDGEGKVSPVRPRFLLYYSDVRPPGHGAENLRLAAEWRPFSPHTVRRGTVPCEGCHRDARRFLREDPREAVYRPGEDGLGLPSFFRAEGQEVRGGAFLDEARVKRILSRSDAYKRGCVEQWKRRTPAGAGAPSSGRR